MQLTTPPLAAMAARIRGRRSAKPGTRHLLTGLALAAAVSGGLGSAVGQVVVIEPALANDHIETVTVLAPGDALKIVVYSRPELTDTYPIGPDGAIRMPLAGTVSVAGLDIESAARTLTRRVSELLDYDVPVTVDIARYRPIFIVGAVASPGEHDYSPGLRVMQAVGRAGGLTLAAGNATTSPIEGIRVRQRLLSSLLEVKTLTVRQAALTCLLEGTETLSLPSDLQNASDIPMLRAMLRDQQALIDVSRKRLRDARDFAARQQKQLDEEIAALQGEERTLKAQGSLVAQELQSTQSLMDKGLTTSSRLLLRQQMAADLRADQHRLAANLSKVRQKKIELEEQLQSTEDEWRQQHLRDITQVSADLEHARTALKTAQEEALILGFAQFDEALGTPGLKDARFTISRTGPDGLKEIEAGPSAELQPGDILQVGLPPLVPSEPAHSVRGDVRLNDPEAQSYRNIQLSPQDIQKDTY